MTMAIDSGHIDGKSTPPLSTQVPFIFLFGTIYHWLTKAPYDVRIKTRL